MSKLSSFPVSVDKIGLLKEESLKLIITFKIGNKDSFPPSNWMFLLPKCNSFIAISHVQEGNILPKKSPS